MSHYGAKKKGQRMEIRKVNISELKAAYYNPRKDLKPEDKEYKKLKKSIDTFGYIEPIVWNEKTGNIVGGHQRCKVLIENGAEEIEVSVVNIDEKAEKKLNVALNRIKGRWDISKLTELLNELESSGDMELTGFEDWELQGLLMQYDHIQDLMAESFSDFAAPKERSTFVMTFSCPAEARETLENYIKNTKNAKEELATVIINKIKGRL